MSVKNLSIRQATNVDWLSVSALLQAHNLPLDGAQAHLGSYLLGLHGQEVVGCAGMEQYGDVGLLRSVAIAPGLQKSGIGRQLVQSMLTEAKRRGVRAMYLLSVGAPEYFAQYGFKRIAREAAPEALQASAEFQGACPACAALMELPLVAKAASNDKNLPVAVIGAGPVGLAAAAHLIARGIQPLILEAGASVGANLMAYDHVRLFSPWRYNVDAAMAEQLKATGWRAPTAEDLPLAGEIVQKVMAPYAKLPQVAAALKLNTRVLRVGREGFDKVKTAGRDKVPFVIHAQKDGKEVAFRARAVIDASGTWNSPNPLGASGIPALGEHSLVHRIFYGIPDVAGRDTERFAGRRTLVVGAGHSAANALLALAELARTVPDTRLVWAVRSPTLQRLFGGGSADALPARGRLGSELKALRDTGGLQFISGLRVSAVREEEGTITVEGVSASGQPHVLTGIDQIVCATGQRPNLQMVSELRLRLDPALESTEALAPLIDPNEHSCGTVRPHGHRELAHPESGFYTLGVKSYGRAPTFLMATGFEQARSVVAALAGDFAAADRVELDLPETGVCGVPEEEEEPDLACCAPAPVAVALTIPAVRAKASGGCCGPAKVVAAAEAASASAQANCCS